MSERWTLGWLGDIRKEVETQYEASLISPYWMPETVLEEFHDRPPNGTERAPEDGSSSNHPSLKRGAPASTPQ